MISMMMDLAGKIKSGLEKKREERKLRKLRKSGMHIGKEVFIPLSTWIDTSHCYMISIGDRCRFGPNCAILAHDATMNEFLDAGKIGRVIIHESCSIGMGTMIMPGVEIGPRVIIGAGSVITKNIPPDSVASGNPARVIMKLDYFLKYHRLMMKRSPLFPYLEYGDANLTEAKRKEMLEKMKDNYGYITGGYTEMLRTGEIK